MSEQAIKVALSDTFLDALDDLPRTQRTRVTKFMKKFRANPTSPGLNYETIQNASDPNLRSVRVDQSYRAIVLKPETGNVYVLLWVDNHDEAYAWATRKRVIIHPKTGSMQIIPVDTSQVGVEPSEVEGAAALFNEFRDRELRRFGVPDELLDTVRAVGAREDFEQLRGVLPDEAFEALYWLAEGDSIEDVYRALMMPPPDDEADAEAEAVDTDDFEAALKRPGSQRHFWVVEDDLELEAMLDEPLERWRVFLHPVQRKLVERDWNGPVRVLGGAGTGKTVVAMHRAKWLVENVATGPDDRVLFTTFTRNLAGDIQANLRELCTADILRKIEVVNLDRWVSEFLARQGYPHEIGYFGSHKVLDDCWQQALVHRPDDLDVPEAFYREEWERVVQDRGVETMRDYFVVSRAGRGVALHRSARKAVWRVFEEYRNLLAAKGVREAADAMRDAGNILAGKGNVLPYASVVVDEAQDMSAEAFRLIRQMIPVERENDVFIVGDAHQRIYRHHVVLSRCGVHIVGRAHRLRINYRTTDEIRAFAVQMLEGVDVDDLDGGLDSISGYKSLVHGEPPQLELAATFEDELDAIVSFIGDDTAQRGTCLIARTQKLIDRYVDELAERGVETYRLTRRVQDDRSVPGLRVATMHRVKGLEFDRVVVAGVNDGVVPLKWAVNSADETVRDAAEKAERALLYVSLTRARRGALVTSFGNPSPFLNR